MVVPRDETAYKYATDKINAKNTIKVWREKKY